MKEFESLNYAECHNLHPIKRLVEGLGSVYDNEAYWGVKLTQLERESKRSFMERYYEDSDS